MENGKTTAYEIARSIALKYWQGEASDYDHVRGIAELAHHDQQAARALWEDVIVPVFAQRDENRVTRIRREVVEAATLRAITPYLARALVRADSQGIAARMVLQELFGANLQTELRQLTSELAAPLEGTAATLELLAEATLDAPTLSGVRHIIQRARGAAQKIVDACESLVPSDGIERDTLLERLEGNEAHRR